MSQYGHANSADTNCLMVLSMQSYKNDTMQLSVQCCYLVYCDGTIDD